MKRDLPRLEVCTENSSCRPLAALSLVPPTGEDSEYEGESKGVRPAESFAGDNEDENECKSTPSSSRCVTAW